MKQSEERNLRDQQRYAIHDVLAGETARLQPTQHVAPAAQPSVGLALSGGGIRSATFALGVLQALAGRRKLASFDYLSTVSGGGYIGSWLSAWIHRAGLKHVQDELAKVGVQPGSDVPAANEPAEVTWLRRYSNYLTPRLGIFSLDSLTLIATWTRNVVLNLIVILAVLGAVMLLPYLAIAPFKSANASPAVFGFAAAWTGLMFVGGIVYNLYHQTLPIGKQRNWLVRPAGVVTVVIGPGLITAWCATVWLFAHDQPPMRNVSALEYLGVLFGFLLIVWLAAEAAKMVGDRSKPAADSPPPRTPREALQHLVAKLFVFAASAIVGIGCGVLALIVIVRLLDFWDATRDPPVLLIALGPPAFLLAFGFASTIFIGLVGRTYWERAREWWSRLNAWFTMLAVVWIIWCAYAYYSLPTMYWLHANLGLWVGALGTGWIGALAASVFGRKPQAASERTQLNVDLALNFAATVFVAGFLFCVAAGTGRAVFATASIPIESAQEKEGAVAETKSGSCARELCEALSCVLDECTKKPAPTIALAAFRAAHLDRLRLLTGSEIFGWPVLPLDFLVLVLIALVFGWRVDVNKFSLHNMYKNRLVRCYLGASNSARNAQPFVGLDDADDVRLVALAEPSQRPFHILNTALNISQGADLAWQERKAASFVFTPLYCGYSMARTQGDTTSIDKGKEWMQKGYRPTGLYAAGDREERGFTLGMALATSGAAVSPNMGHASQSARAFVLTLFNARLGRWSPNPLQDKYDRPSPAFGVVQLLQELLGYSNEQRNFVYLSDGGHFENLGLYELVRRRCRTIFVVDSGQDPDREFGDLGEAIRKCRIDLGVEIRFDELEPLRVRNDGAERVLPEQGHLVGTIDYGDDHAGTIVLLKPTMTRARDEPVDVQNYAANNPAFPQETTADQWFSESQFESYRRLGLHVGRHCLDAYGTLLPDVEPPNGGPPAPPSPTEQPTWPTRLIGLLFRRKDLPPRKGSLVEYFVVALATTLVGFVAFGLYDKVALPNFTQGLCRSLADCRTATQALLDADRASSFWCNAVVWRTIFDNFFVLAYTGTFVMAYVIAVLRSSFMGVRTKAIMLAFLCALATLGAAADYGENFTVLAGLNNSVAHDAIAQATAGFTLAKLVLLAVNAVAVLLCVPKIVAAVVHRWRTS